MGMGNPSGSWVQVSHRSGSRSANGIPAARPRPGSVPGPVILIVLSYYLLALHVNHKFEMSVNNQMKMKISGYSSSVTTYGS